MAKQRKPELIDFDIRGDKSPELFRVNMPVGSKFTCNGRTYQTMARISHNGDTCARCSFNGHPACEFFDCTGQGIYFDSIR